MAKKATVAGVPGQDPTLPSVSFVVKGEKYNLCFDFNAVAIVYQQTGINLLDEGAVSNPNPVVIRALLYAALLKNHPDMTVDAAGSLITLHNVTEIMTAVGNAWEASNPEADSKNAPSVPADPQK
jgi:hypothetical protein